MRTMYDAVTASNIPSSATLVAGYGDGYYQNTAEMRARFPHATVVEIAVSPHHNLGVVLDVENGDASPSQAPGWVNMRRAAGVDPTVYCNSSTWPAVRSAFQAAGVAEPHYWIAQYDGNPGIPGGAVAKQYRDVGPYDLSSVADYWPGVDSPPAPTPPPVPPPVPPEDIVTPQDKLDIAQLVWDHTEPNPMGGQARMGTMLAWRDQDQTNQTAELERRIDASTAAIIVAVTQLHPGADTATIVAAVQAAVAAAVVKVDVNVTGPAAGA